MAGSMIHTSKGNYGGRFTLYVLFACIIGASGGLLFGYDIGISGGVTSMDEFLLEFFPSVYEHKHTAKETDYCKYDSQILQFFSSSLYIAGLISGFGSSWLASKYGRKRSMLFGGITFFIGGILNGAAQNIAMLIIGRILLGVGVGCATQTVPMYLSEMAPSQWRGGLNIAFQFLITLGIVIANMINYATSKMSKDGWRISLGLASVPAIIVILGGIFCPETPNSLIERNLKEEGKSILRKIRGVENIDTEYEDIVEATNMANQVTNPYKTLLSKKYRPQFILSILIPLFQQLSGINVVMFYAPVLFNTIGFGADASLYSAVIVGVVNILSTIVSIVLVDKLGRRALFLEGGVQMIICQIFIAWILGTQFGGDVVLSKAYGTGVLVLVCLFVAGFAWSWGPLGWLVPSEILPMEVRSAGQAIVVSVNLLLTFIIGQVFLTILCSFKYGAFIFFAVWEIIATLFIYFFVPETKGVSIEKMVLIWEDHWFWKRMVRNSNGIL
ncbi:hypothetical protein KC19_6G026600 [Ceratodon purpureus]|uniref:Major facilitator superfamily (MFS) profile domain-containing protein n=1 Tax=Ceratodon purpureus TaxID=3225 RepID=A0A8T0HC89_CERPU|nr:hypothetical protein KC19_6G026600 [Ceratodon purpureus]